MAIASTSGDGRRRHWPNLNRETLQYAITWSPYDPHQEDRCKELSCLSQAQRIPPTPAGRLTRCSGAFRRHVEACRFQREQERGAVQPTLLAWYGNAADQGATRLRSESDALKIKECTTVNPHSVFLRNECMLPLCLDPLREPIGDGWSRVEEIAAPVFDTMVRQAGWHFVWV